MKMKSHRRSYLAESDMSPWEELVVEGDSESDAESTKAIEAKLVVFEIWYRK